VSHKNRSPAILVVTSSFAGYHRNTYQARLKIIPPFSCLLSGETFLRDIVKIQRHIFELCLKTSGMFCMRHSVVANNDSVETNKPTHTDNAIIQDDSTYRTLASVNRKATTLLLSIISANAIIQDDSTNRTLASVNRKATTLLLSIISVNADQTHTQLFNGPLSGITWVGQYRKKHSPTHTQSILIIKHPLSSSSVYYNPQHPI